MQVLIVGSGKLASELLQAHSLPAPFVVDGWSGPPSALTPAIVVHAGSGRALDEVIAYCHQTGSVLLELATGSKLEGAAPGFPVVLCPNTNILMLKFMNMLAHSGKLFQGCRIGLTESHQSEKRSTPGTALAMAQSLGLAAADVVSVRDRDAQQTALHIPPAHLDRHAVHSISIDDGSCRIVLETRVYGAAPYAEGVSRIVAAAAARPLEHRVYQVAEFVENGWV